MVPEGELGTQQENAKWDDNLKVRHQHRMSVWDFQGVSLVGWDSPGFHFTPRALKAGLRQMMGRGRVSAACSFLCPEGSKASWLSFLLFLCSFVLHPHLNHSLLQNWMRLSPFDLALSFSKSPRISSSTSLPPFLPCFCPVFQGGHQLSWHLYHHWL